MKWITDPSSTNHINPEKITKIGKLHGKSEKMDFGTVEGKQTGRELGKRGKVVIGKRGGRTLTAGSPVILGG